MTTTKKATHLRPGFSASVTTTDNMTVHTAIGPVVMPAELYVRAGAALPDNLADGEYDRLAKLGAFDPLPPAPVAGLVETVNAQDALNTPRGDEPKTGADVRFPTEAELVARDALEQAQADVRDALAEAEAEAAAPDETDAKPARKSK